MNEILLIDVMTHYLNKITYAWEEADRVKKTIASAKSICEDTWNGKAAIAALDRTEQAEQLLQKATAELQVLLQAINENISQLT